MRKKIVATGDSIVQDLTTHVFTAAARMAEINITFDSSDTDRRYMELVNTGIGGHTTEMIASRFYRDAVQLKPDIIVVNGGTNDLWGWESPERWFEPSWRLILEQCRENSLIAAVLGIVPATGFFNDMMLKRDSLNRTLKSMIEGYNDYVYIDADKYVGMHRPAGDPDNLWDIKPEYDMDGVHFTRAGSEKIAQAVLDAIRHLLA